MPPKYSSDSRVSGPPTRPWSGWRTEPGWLLLPLRAFLGVTFTYAGLQKLANPGYLDPNNPTSVAHQMGLLRRSSPIGFLLGLSAHAPTLVGLLIAFGELAVGLGTLIGLWTRVAAIGGALLSLAFFLSVSWNTTPYYYGSDIVFVFAWLVILGFGSAGVLSVDGWLRARARRELHLAPEPAAVAVDAPRLRACVHGAPGARWRPAGGVPGKQAARCSPSKRSSRLARIRSWPGAHCSPEAQRPGVWGCSRSFSAASPLGSADSSAAPPAARELRPPRGTRRRSRPTRPPHRRPTRPPARHQRQALRRRHPRPPAHQAPARNWRQALPHRPRTPAAHRQPARHQRRAHRPPRVPRSRRRRQYRSVRPSPSPTPPTATQVGWSTPPAAPSALSPRPAPTLAVPSSSTRTRRNSSVHAMAGCSMPAPDRSCKGRHPPRLRQSPSMWSTARSGSAEPSQRPISAYFEMSISVAPE